MPFRDDLADRDARRELFDRIWTTGARATVLTEGVLGALSVDEAGSLADDLRAQPGCESWVIDHFSPRLLTAYQKYQPHPNVPVRFDAPSWEAFFTEGGWRVNEIRFLGEESERLHRPVPLSPLDRVMRLFVSTTSGHGLREDRADRLRRRSPHPRRGHDGGPTPTASTRGRPRAGVPSAS